MPEQLKPCPACGETPIVNADSGHVICCKIVVDDVDCWNSLPRALTWTTEPPKVAGWYWWRDVSHKGEATIQYMSQSQVERLKTYPGEEWAGPILAPRELEES